ncbi:MarR family winged helix-turn-helix transcriptional regulator [Actinacidiphila yeochonensis]|uniref:MarR family winged helix-turn-helix transcriptional regulator n=1 Tax=Actinacidiphila yeochonensis TaxID=89050 RepID=UPI000689FD73|nr:MarR family transcriptional regulator [Actinacidiphila yeochonensis]
MSETEKQQVARPEIVELEQELMLVGRHSVLRGQSAASPEPEAHLERSAYILLSRIEVDGPQSIGQLAEAFGLDTSTVNRQTAAMLRSGLAERISDPEGGLARKLRITPEGARRMRAYRAWVVTGLSDLLSDWNRHDVSAFSGYLARFNSAIEGREGRPWPRPAG